MTPFEYVALGAAVVGTATSTYVGVSSASASAKTASRAAAIEMQQHEAEKKTAMLAADQEQAAIEAARARAISASASLRAGRGLDPFSATGRQLFTDMDEEVDADLETSKANAGAVQNRNLLAQQATGIRARNEITSARAGGIGAVAGGIGSVARLASTTGTSGGNKYLSKSVSGE